MKLRESRPDGCVSDFALDCRIAGELDAAAASAASEHLATCTRCASRLAELLRARDAFVSEAPALRPPKARAPGRTRGRAATSRVALALALAAALALFVQFRGRRAGTAREGDATRAKGGAASLGFYVNHGGMVRRGGPGERVRPGDALRFVVTSRDLGYFVILSVDGMRQASLYYPRAADSARIEVGFEVALPEGTTLDDTPGDETIYGVFCPHPFAVEPLRLALSSSPGSPPSPVGCTVEALHVHKEARAEP